MWRGYGLPLRFKILGIMKHISRKVWKAVFGAVCMGGLCAACTSRPGIHITGSVRHADGALLVCQRSVGGMFNSQTFDTLKLQADSTFTLTLPGGEYERVQFYLYGKKNMGSLLAKEGTMRIELDGWAEKPMTVTEGQDDKTVRVAELLDQLYDDVFAIRARRGERWQIARDTVATSVRRKLTDYALSLEGSLKLKEISYIHSEAYAAGELKHGTISLVEDGTLVVALASYLPLFDKTMSNVKEVKARGAYVLGLTVEGKTEIEKETDFVFYLPATNAMMQPSLMVVPLQLFAYYVAAMKGCDIDKPRNLAKSVTVE